MLKNQNKQDQNKKIVKEVNNDFNIDIAITFLFLI